MLNKYPFIVVAALCSFLGAVTTAILIYLPNPIPSDFENQSILSNNFIYLFKLWVLFFHPQFNFIASLGVGFLLFRKYPWSIIAGLIFLFIWAYSEMSQQALLIDTLNQFWRPGYQNADSDEEKELYKTLITGISGLSDSKYFLVIYSFGIGSLLFGSALVNEDYLGRWIGWSFIFIGLLSLSSFCRYYLGITFINDVVNWLYQWVYGYLQPVVRIAIGIWLIREIKLLKNPACVKDRSVSKS